MDLDLAALIRPINDLAAEAGLRIMEIYATAFTVAQKQDSSPLTAADMVSHQAITAGLHRLTPTIPVLSEEESNMPFTERSRWERYWLVDPLDGTKEFINRNGEFTVNIALIEAHAPILGVVYVPVSGLCYYAARSQGAFRQEAGEEACQIAVQTLPEGPVRLVSSRSHSGDREKLFATGLGEYITVPVGSSLKFCLVAEGRADVYPRLGPTWEWDTAAAQCIVEEAGGHVIAVTGKRLFYNTKESLLNPHFLVFGDASRDWLAYLPPAAM